MINVSSSETAIKLVTIHFRSEEDIKKRSLYLQEIISMSRKERLWLRALSAYFGSPMELPSLRALCKN